MSHPCIIIDEDLHAERAGWFRAFFASAGPDSQFVCSVVGYASPGGSHRTIRECVREVRRLGYNDDIYRLGRIIDRCPKLAGGRSCATALKPAFDNTGIR